MTLSALAKTVSGTEIPSCFAALRFTTSSNLVGRSMGKSPGFAPLSTFATRSAERSAVESLTGYSIGLARLRRYDGTLLRSRSIVLERSGPEPPPWWARF